MICIDHFEERFIIQHQNKVALNYSLNPIPTIHPSHIPLSLVSVPSESRKLPAVRIFQPDELESFKSSQQQEVQYDGRDLSGTSDVQKRIVLHGCLFKATPYVLRAIPLIKINNQIVQEGILNCIQMLSREQFNVRAVVSDNHSTNVSAYRHLKGIYPCTLHDNAITNPFNPEKHIYLIYDTVHLIKNIRNNLLATKCFQIPELETSLMDVAIKITSGSIHWSIFHSVHEKDLALECHVRKAPKISYQALHPGNNKQSVPLALSIFDLTTITAIHQYFPEDKTTSPFLNLVYNWWLIVNAKERFHPNIVGNALIASDGKIEFLKMFANWLSDWRESKKLGLSKQTFDALISTSLNKFK